MYRTINQLTAAKSEQHQSINEEKLDDIDDHTSQRNLQGSKMRINAEYVYQLQKTETKTNNRRFYGRQEDAQSLAFTLV